MEYIQLILTPSSWDVWRREGKEVRCSRSRNCQVNEPGFKPNIGRPRISLFPLRFSTCSSLVYSIQNPDFLLMIFKITTGFLVLWICPCSFIYLAASDTPIFYLPPSHLPSNPRKKSQVSTRKASLFWMSSGVRLVTKNHLPLTSRGVLGALVSYSMTQLLICKLSIIVILC